MDENVPEGKEQHADDHVADELGLGHGQQAHAHHGTEHQAHDGGNGHQRNDAALIQVNPCGRGIRNGEQELGRTHADLERHAHQQVEHGDVGPARAEAEHTGHDADDDEEQQTNQRAMRLPVHHFAGAGLKKNAVHAERHAHGVLHLHFRAHGVLGHEQQHGNGQNGDAKAGLHNIGGQSQTEQRAHDGTGGGNERHGQGQTQIGEITPQQTGTGSQSARQSHQQTGAAHKVKMEGEEAAYQRHEEHAAAHAGHNGDDAENEAEEQQRHGPEPPRMIIRVHGFHVGRGGRGLHRGSRRLFRRRNLHRRRLFRRNPGSAVSGGICLCGHKAQHQKQGRRQQHCRAFSGDETERNVHHEYPPFAATIALRRSVRWTQATPKPVSALSGEY